MLTRSHGEHRAIKFQKRESNQIDIPGKKSSHLDFKRSLRVLSASLSNPPYAFLRLRELKRVVNGAKPVKAL